MQNNLATEILARAGLRLAWGDADPGINGAVLRPEEMVGWEVRHLAPVVCRDENGDLGHATSPDADISSLEYRCIGRASGTQLGDADALWLVQALLGQRDTWPSWARPVERGVEFLLVDEDRFCLRHRDSDHRHAYVCRIWLDVDGKAVDLTRIDWAAMALLRAELESQAAMDEARALMARAEIRERARAWREEQNQIRADARIATNRSNPAEVSQRNSSTRPGMLSQSGAMVNLDDSGVAAPANCGHKPITSPPDRLPPVGEGSTFSGED